VVCSDDGTPVDTLLQVVEPQKWVRSQGNAWGIVDPIFGPDVFAATVGDELWAGTSDEPRWTRVAPSGDTLGYPSLPYDPVEAADEEVAAERARRLKEVEIPDVRLTLAAPGVLDRIAEGRREGIREAPVHPFVPAYDRMVSGGEGAVWIRRYRGLQSESSEWVEAHSASGSRRRFLLPARASVLGIREGFVLVSDVDSLEVPVLRVLQLQ